MHDLYRAADFNPALKKINRFSVEKMHQKMEMIYKCPCFFVDNEAQYFNKVLELSDMLVKAKGLTRIVKSSVTIEEHPDLSFLMVGNGIGEQIAQNLINEFGSPKNVLYASRDDLLEVNGVGDSTITKIKELKRRKNKIQKEAQGNLKESLVLTCFFRSYTLSYRVRRRM